MQDNKPLHAAVTVWTTLVNTHTHTDRQTDGFWMVIYHKPSSARWELAKPIRECFHK